MGNSSRATFYEVYAQDCLLPALRPAVKYVLSVLAERHVWAARLLPYDEEVFSGLVLLLETHYLRAYDATFAENFYGLRRVPTRDTSSSTGGDDKGTGVPSSPSLNKPRSQGSRRLSVRLRLSSLLFLVGLPYVKRSLDNLYQRWSQLEDSGNGNGGNRGGMSVWRSLPNAGAPRSASAPGRGAATSADTMQRIKLFLRRWFVKLYPFIHAAYEGSRFVYQVSYLFEMTRYYSPWLHMQRLEIHRLNVHDIRSQLAAQILRTRATLPGQGENGISGGLWRIVAWLQSVLFHVSPYILPGFFFVWKFLEWWYATEGHRTADDALPVPPAPKAAPPADDGLSLPKDDRHCPLCRKLRSNPAMTPSGYVFCYTCVFEYVNTHHACPVTLMPANVDAIRKLYESA